ncbi:MAG TPA: GNAT family N-acetyltransferase [Rhodopseudomonas sp.]|uniref:GNAT family N-acetyltransferase n=1 Tax=Rhodopseudomonas sp. TaxID=1078 RepID=UPI002ED8C2E7
MSLSLRTANRDDVALVLGFVRELADYEKLSHEVDATEPMIAEALFGAQPRAFCEIAEWEGAPVGFALWFSNYSSFRGRHGIYLEDLFVRSAFRGRGVGKALLAALARRCVQNGWTRFEWSVLNSNASAIAFYKSIGATMMNEWTTFRLSGQALQSLASRSST